ncbi:MAG: TolC family protein [Deltaproteobacteria bacterium]|nr:TolC family protein [Deltaproteobacteria bacterium]
MTAAPETLMVSLPELLARAEKNAALVKDFNALRRSAELKITQVETNRWLSSLELKVIGGVVPDAKIDTSVPVPYNVSGASDGKSFSNLGPFTRVEIEAVQPIFTFGKISGYAEMASHAPELASLENKKKLGEVRSLVKRAYYTLLLATDSSAILNEVQSKLNDASEKVEELLIKNADNVSEIDRLKIRVFLADVKNRALDADRGIKLSRSALSELSSLAGDWELDQKTLQAEKLADPNKADIISIALRAKPELNQLQQVIQVKKAEKKVVMSDYFPTIFAGGKIEYASAPGRTDVSNPFLKNDFNYFNMGVILGLKQDLGFHRTYNKVDAVSAEIERMSALFIQLEVKTRLDAERSFEEAVSAQEGIKINEDGFRAARSWLTSAGLSFNLGTSETKDVLESFAAYFKARADLIKSVYTLNLALTDLSQTIGVEVVDRLK